MKLFDTHCHIADSAFDEDRDAVIARFLDAGVRKATVIADPCDEVPNQDIVFPLAERYPFLYTAIGVHPHNAIRYDDTIEKLLTDYMHRRKNVLWGEIGLDYHYDLSPRTVQREVFARQLELAYEHDIPVQLHIREAHGDCADILRPLAASGKMPSGIMHCYTGSWEMAKVYMDLGLYISLSGAVTFKNAPKLCEVAVNMPSDRLLIETDCPYMAPVPLRGRRNEPAFITHTFAKIAELRSVSPDTLSDQLWANAHSVLNLDPEEQI